MHLIFLHAFPLDSRMWNGQTGILPKSTSAPTLYALGDSMEAWAKEVLEAADSGPLIVIGCSMGGSCALEMARQAGERIAALVLVGSKAGHRPEPDVRDSYVSALRDGGVERVWSSLAGRFFSPEAEPGVIETIEAIAMEQNAEDLIRAIEVFHSRPDATEVVMNWQKPLLVIGGDQDGLVSVEKSKSIARSAPYGQLHIMRGCGHFVNMERPAEFNAILGDLVRSIA